MDALIAVAGVIAVAAITPGPNNLVVMLAAQRAGIVGALPSIAGVLAGSLALFAVALTGVGVMVMAEPALRTAITLAGCAYLTWLGTKLVVRRTASPAPAADPLSHAHPQSGLPNGLIGLFAFQFLNPKAWVLVLTATAAAQGPEGIPAPAVALLFVVIPALCLLLWSALGRSLTHWMQRPAARTRFDRAMGVLLIASALALAAGSP